MKFINKDTINKMYSPRLKTDSFFELAPGSFDYNGVYDTVTRFVEAHQSKNSELWRTFVGQFRFPTDAPVGGWSGEYWGKMMRGACWVYKYTMDEELYKIIEDAVRDLLTTQDEYGRFSSYEKEREFTYWDMWCRKYVLLGMQYFYDICKCEELKATIVSALNRHLDYIISKVGEGEGQLDILDTTTHNPETWGALNSSSILEPVVRQYSLTGDTRYLDFAAYLVRRGGSKWGNIYTLAIEGIKAPYEYPVRKAYEATSYFEGVLEYYRVTGDEDARRAFVNFMARVVETDFTIIGCAGTEHELFNHSSLVQTEPNELVKQETCVTVTLMKAFYQALCLTGEAKYADAMERAGYNAMLGAINLNKSTAVPTDKSAREKGLIVFPFIESIGGYTFDSYSPLYKDKRNRAVGGFRMMPGNRAYGCCACIGAAGVAVMPLSSVMATADGVVINHFMNGKVKIDDTLEIEMETLYPYGEEVKIKVNTTTPCEFNLKIRVPEYAIGKMTVDGECITADECGYFNIKKSWCCGDTVAVVIPREFKLTVLNNRVALTKGVIVYAIDERVEDIDKKLGSSIVKVEPISLDIKTREAVKVTFENGESVVFVDYASAGADWSADKPRVTIWADMV